MPLSASPAPPTMTEKHAEMIRLALPNDFDDTPLMREVETNIRAQASGDYKLMDTRKEIPAPRSEIEVLVVMLERDLKPNVAKVVRGWLSSSTTEGA